ncbi:Reverse transcriptase (RNA-dependent DNA polymerase) [Salegentibacter holothuriorum]|uniref:Reverse transcriptase (RNA-dependent DNA polymerase) n=1 Tax=Salegentibacter holothuriorum TaxID=241145 RepID=A0A1T5E9Y1_9FLAO|nr:RNA-directed DNA polymerase [Salegentibacter holothuriorum]SKB80754.1 Reverse transcriptase (RNA-dependent DNA polymerase) [Salegentibacter holothuriorum]
MQTERFNRLRKEALKKIFEKNKITKVWRKIVKNQLRSLDLKDLYDHYDFNYNIEDRALAIRNEILNGTYKVSQPLIYRIEKKFGVCRHIVIPQPNDAVVLQVLVENINDKILENQPSKNAFYSRDRHNTAFPHEVEEYGFTWRQQWKQLQKKIYNFHDQKELIVVTDLSNYYDSIDLEELRKVFTSFTKIDEVLIDLLFRIIQEIAWKPDYLPYSRRGLPTANIEGIRLLAHSFLFEVDEVVKQKTGNSFTRWMDDIVMGVNTKKEAIETLSSVSDMLKTRGLALNLAKTSIYSEEEGYYHFQIEQNRYIDNIENTEKTDSDYTKIKSDLHRKFKSHFKDQTPKYWDKISKRYITTYSKLGSTSLLNILPEKYIDYPGLRSHLLMYLSKIGYRKKSAEVALEIIQKIDVFDDLSLYQLCLLVTNWEIPLNEDSKQFLDKFEGILTTISFKRKLSSDFYCILWFKAKYNHPEDLYRFINNYKNLWQTDAYLRRQVTAILARLFNNNSKVEKLLYNQISSGITNTVTLANQIFYFSELEKLDNKLNFYLFPKNIQRPYPLGKFLVLASVLNSEKIRTDKEVQKKIKENIRDPYYLKWLDFQYNIN